jgi:pimeloyl-ACP methyl ester carboxylesterase
VKSPIPILFVSGTLDGHTPPNRAAEVCGGFPRGTHLVIENAGHDDVATAPGLGDLIVRFLGGAEVADAKLSVPAMQFQSIR